MYKVKESVLLLHGDKRTATFSCVVTYLKAPQQIERYKNLVEPIPPPPAPWYPVENRKKDVQTRF